MRKRDVDRLWKQLLAIHPNGQFWKDPKNRDVGYNRFKKSLMSKNPLVGLVEKESYKFTEESSTTQARPPSLQPEAPLTIQSLNAENDATAATAATANVETQNNSQISDTESESEKTLDIRLREMKERSRIVKANSKRTRLQKEKLKKLCHKQMTKQFKEAVKECQVEDLSRIPKRPRGRPSKKKNTSEQSAKKDENGLKKFKFFIEYDVRHKKIVLLPNKSPSDAHAGLLPLDLVKKNLNPTNRIEFEHEQDAPLDLTRIKETTSLQNAETRDPDEISDMVSAGLNKSAIDMPNLDNDEVGTFVNEQNHDFNEMQLQSNPDQNFSSVEEICSDQRERPVEINSTPENTDISTKSLIATDQDKGSINTPVKKIISEDRCIANQTELSSPHSNSMDYTNIYSENDLENGGAIETNLNKLGNEKSSSISGYSTKGVVWDELLEINDSSSDDNNPQDNITDTSIKDTDGKAQENSENTNFNVSDLVDLNEILDFEPDDDVMSVATSWNGSDDELCSPPKKTNYDVKEMEKVSESDVLPKRNGKDSFCLGPQPLIQALGTSTPITVVPHPATYNSDVITQPKKIAFKIPKTINKIEKIESSSPLVLGKDSAEQQQKQQQSRHPEPHANRMMIDSCIPCLITPGSVSYTSLPPISRRNSFTFAPKNIFSQQTPMGSIVAPIVDNMPPDSLLRSENSRLNQQANLHKWCKDIFGITCVRFLEGPLNCPGSCKLSHEIHNPGEIQNTIFRLNRNELKQAYLFAKRNKIIFEKTMKLFVNTYAIRKQVNDILFAINDCRHYPNCCEQLLTPIHDSLMQCGYSAPNACIEIASRLLNQQSISMWPKVLDKIIDLIMSSAHPSLIEYVVKIMKMPNYKLPPYHLSAILDEALWSENIDFINKIIETLSILSFEAYKENVPKVKELLAKVQTNRGRLEENHNAELNPEYVAIFKDTN